MVNTQFKPKHNFWLPILIAYTFTHMHRTVNTLVEQRRHFISHGNTHSPCSVSQPDSMIVVGCCCGADTQLSIDRELARVAGSTLRRRRWSGPDKCRAKPGEGERGRKWVRWLRKDCVSTDDSDDWWDLLNIALQNLSLWTLPKKGSTKSRIGSEPKLSFS